MTDDRQIQETPRAVDRPGAGAAAFNSIIGTLGISIVVFIVGVVVGFPLATFGVEFFTQNAGIVFGILFGFFVLVILIAGALIIFRKMIWQKLFKRGEIEMERFARPLSDVARFAAQQKVAEATDSARDLAELVLARYAWVSTRRWLMATITAFIAAIAALAGSALLFQQNQLLRTQIGLSEQQNQRIAEQNAFIEAQIELGEAQRSTSIVPEILEIGSLMGQEVDALKAAGKREPIIADLSGALRARIVAATTAARPYRYLRSPLLDIDPNLLVMSGLIRRDDLPASKVARTRMEASTGQADPISVAQSGVLSDRPVSPERGQIIVELMNTALYDTSALSGADFSFAEVRVPQLKGMQFRGAMLRFADFDRIIITDGDFSAAFVEQARFRNSWLDHVDFMVVNDVKLGPRLTELAGTDFSSSRINDVRFTGSRGYGINFDGAVLHNVDFTNTQISGSTFRNAVFGTVNFTNADLGSVDFDGALVFDPAFLDTLATQAVAGRFDKTRFALEPVDNAVFAAHPRWADAALGGAEDGQCYRVVRIKEFE